jgi:hypothetical protein
LFMEATYTYDVLRRLFAVIIILPVLFISYGFIRDAFPVENYLYSILCMVVSIAFGAFSMHILNEFWVKILINNEGISVKRLYKSYCANWEDIVEYGRYQTFGRGGDNWRYYLKISGYGDKKFLICSQGIKDLKRLNAHIIAKVKTAKFNNIGPGMIW